MTSMRRLSFSAVQWNDITDVSDKLKLITSDLELLSQDVQHRVDTAKENAVKQQRLGGGRQSLKRQLQSLKSSLLNLGQKETFSESVVDFYDGVDFKLEADRSAGAVESAEEDLKELKKANEQDCESLQEAIRMVSNYQEQYNGAMSRVLQHLKGSRQAFSLLQEKRAQVEATLKQPDGDEMDDDTDLEALLEMEMERAQKLEADIAEADAGCIDLQTAILAEAEAEEQREAEIVSLQEMMEDKAKAEAAGKHGDSLEWYDELLSIMSLPWSGITAVDVEEDSLRVQLSQCIPSTWDIKSDAYETVEHSLAIVINSTTGRLSSATLQPASFDISGDLECARFLGGAGSLAHLVTAVRGHVRDHFRRQLLISEASSLSTIRPMAGTSLVRSHLPASGLEAEFDIPFGWPGNGKALKLVQVVSPISAVDCSALFEAITSSAPVLLGVGAEQLSIKEFLGTADVAAQSLHTYKA